MKKILIAFTGKKGSGKSTACEYIERTRSSQSRITRINFKDALIAEIRISFPDLLQEIAQNLHLTVDELFTTKPYPPYIRNLLVNYGTDLRRNEDPDHWVYAWNDLYLHSDADIILNDDTRFINEAALIQSEGGFVIRIINTQNKEAESTHASETEMDNIIADWTITASNVEELEAGVEAFLSSLDQSN